MKHNKTDKLAEELAVMEISDDNLEQVTCGVNREALKEKLNPSVLQETLESQIAIIEDSDIAEEATSLARAQVAQQAEQAMIASSNQRMANVLTLLQ